MALTRKGANYDYGTTGVTATGLDSVTNFEVSSEYETDVQARDSNGEVAAWLYGDQRNEMSVEGFAETAALPALGGILTIKGKNGIITRASVVGSNEDFAKVRMEGKGYEGIALV
jgi:hypothetical protein